MSDMSLTGPAPLCPVAPDRQCDLGSPRALPDRSGRVGSVGVMRCRYCGHGVTYPALADVAFLYEGRESQDFQPTSVGLSRAIKRIAFRLSVRQMLRQVEGHPRRILDFGCGSGLFTRCVGDLLPDTEVVASDFHENPPADLEGRPYISNDRLDLEQGTFDLVTAFHVIEHDDDPVRLMQRLAMLGTRETRFIFEVPNIDCAWSGIFNKSWDNWYLPFHRVHFSRASFRSAVERTGLVIEREIDICIPSMGRSLANLLGTRNSLPLLLAGMVLHPLQWLVERLTGRPSALRIIARKN